MPAVLNPAAFAAASRLSGKLLAEFLLQGEPWDVRRWVLSYTVARRRKDMIRALRAYEERGARHKEFHVIKAFVKTELLPFFKGTPDGPSSDLIEYVARLIQAPHDETHLVAGPYLKPLVYRLKQVWHPDNWIFYASTSPQKLDHWLNSHSGAVSWFWSDYSAFDATYSHMAWDLIESFYRKIYPDAPQDFWDVLKIWRRPYGKVRVRKEDRWIEYQSDVCNASGRDDTALANAILNGLALSLSFAAAFTGKEMGDLTSLDIELASNVFSIAVVGDDSLVACSVEIEPFLEKIQRHIEEFGLTAKMGHSSDLCDVTFLGMMPFPVGRKFYWGPTIGRRGYKAFWQCEPVGNLPAWTKGVARQLSLYQCVPILSDMADRVLELLPKYAETQFRVDENRTWSARTEGVPRWDVGTVDWLCRRYRNFGLNRAMVESDLKVIRSIERLPAVVFLYTMNAAVCTDDL